MMKDMDGDWIEDEGLTAEQKMQIFESLERVEVGPERAQKVTITHSLDRLWQGGATQVSAAATR